MTETLGKVHLRSPGDIPNKRQHEIILCPHVRNLFTFIIEFSICIHITENFLHLCVADGLVEVYRLDSCRVDDTKLRQHQK